MTKIDTDKPAVLREHEDRKIEEAINRKLNAVMTWDTSDVQVSVHEASVLLTGSVADTKALEQTVLVVFTVKGVRQIDNKLSVRRESMPATGTMSKGTDEDHKRK